MMRGYTTDYVNLIAGELRDHYENGFPVLKELVQNADDAKARTLIFGLHEGFHDASHPLLKGPGLWFFNDGAFEEKDARDLRSFGINSKAGDTDVIGKFGLGMKSVFHLCEALFYVAWDGTQLRREGLTPWKQDPDGPSPHPEWDETDDADWDRLTDHGKGLAAERDCKTWFLLRLPLRMKEHLRTDSGRESAPIIDRFPGDDPARGLTFLTDRSLAHAVAEMLPLLRRLERVEHRGKENSFVLTLEGGARLLGDPPCEVADGRVAQDGQPLLAFSARWSRSPDKEHRFAAMKNREEWPRIRCRDELGHERPAPDKSSPEAAVLFCSGIDPVTPSRLRWAVFLPVGEGSEPLRTDSGGRGHSLVLHGQFFLDRGRKRIHGLDQLHETPADLAESQIEESRLRTTWNQRLTQDVLLPLVLPALERHAERQKLSDADCGTLAKALSGSEWFGTFRTHVCRDASWMRTLEPESEPRWRLVTEDDRSRLRPVPTPPHSAPDRPWKVFPRLAGCDVAPYDVNAPRLGDAPRQWQEAELTDLLSQVEGLFAHATAMDYLAEFLDSCARPCLDTENLQRRLLVLLRSALRAAGREARRQFVKKAERLLGFLASNRRLDLSAELPEEVLASLWEIDAPLLLVPKGLKTDPEGKAAPDEHTLADWLTRLDRALDSNQGRQGPILDAVQQLLNTLPAEARRRVLQANRALRIIGVLDPLTGVEEPVSLEVVERLRETRTLFSFAGGLREARMAIAPQLARAIPETRVRLVRAETYRQLLPDDEFHEVAQLHAADDGPSCLAAVGRYAGRRLGGIAERRQLLERANDPGQNAQDADARHGLRLLLHGSVDHRTDDGTRLWINRHGQHSVWRKLWASIHVDAQWSLVPDDLAGTIPRVRWTQADITEIDAPTLIRELRGKGIETPEEFTVEERAEILSRIEDKDLWRRQPLHTTLDGTPVSAEGERVYLAPGTGNREDSLIREATLIAPSGNPVVAKRQQLWLRRLDDQARIEIALGTEKPYLHWRSIMDALSLLQPDALEDMKVRLRRKAWLPTTRATPVKPQDVIDLTSSLGDEAHRIVVEHRKAPSQCFAVPAELHDAVRKHEAWGRLQEAFSSGAHGLDRLRRLLEDLPRYRVGEWPKPPQPDALRLLARYSGLPGWRLLEAAAATEPFDLETVWTRFKPALSRAIDAERLVAALNWLSEDEDQWKIRKAVHDIYLRQLANHGQFSSDHLPRLRFASADRRWRQAAELCSGAHGVVRASVLDHQQAGILRKSVRHADLSAAHEPTEAPDDVPETEFKTLLQTAPEVLHSYFEGWGGLVPAPMIGALLGLLGPRLRESAERYLKPHSFEWLVRRLPPWKDPEWPPQRFYLALDRAKAAVPAKRPLDIVNASVVVPEGSHVQVHNLLGQPMRVALDSDAPTILAGALRVNSHEGYRVAIPLRLIDPHRLQPGHLAELLRATAETLYSELYHQGSVDLSPLWRELDRSDQLAIGVARRLILDHVPFYLRQLSVKCAPLEEQLAICDSRRRRDAEAEGDGQSAESARKDLREAQEKLAGGIDERPDAVVQAVRGKLEQYQYDPSSIPFELFQNADDAAVELGQLHAHPSQGCKVPEAAQRFVVDERADGLGFAHWGRPVNARGPIDFNGERLGYDRDLEKMLILSASDKPDHEGVTGKFGLGFKSVLLACEQPRILSGRLAIRVVGGILPQPWTNAQESRRRLTDLATDSRLPGTLIDLPGVPGELRDQVLGRFRELSGILCAFGRTVRTIEAVGPTPSTWRWQPREVCPGVEAGDLDLPGDWGPHTKALCVRTAGGSLLMALGPRGFRPLPDTVPTLWVTAPTSDSLPVGFAVNGEFDVDAGRGRLSAGATNPEKARRIGTEVGDALGALLQRSSNAWVSFSTQLGLAADLEDLDFWESIWLGLAKTCLSPKGGAGADLVRTVALRALTRLSESPRAVPNGLKGPLHGFTDAARIRYELSGVLLRVDVTDALGRWTPFTACCSAATSVSPEIGRILREAELCDPKTLDLPALPALLDESRAGPSDAEVLGRLLLMTKGAPDWNSADLRNRLDNVLFQSEAGQWVEPQYLLTPRGTGLDPDERKRHELAPPERRLHPDYCVATDDEWPPVAFFLLCRPRVKAPAELIAQWVLKAESLEARSAAIRYLADGELGERVAGRVREQGWLNSVLEDPELNPRDILKPAQFRNLSRRLVPQRHVESIVDSCRSELHPCPRGEYRSIEEETIARVLRRLEIEFRYELPLGSDLLPDFSFFPLPPPSVQTRSAPPDCRIIWEHLGMYDDSDYRQKWSQKLGKYRSLGYLEDETLFTTKDLDPERILSTALAIKDRLQAPTTAPASSRNCLQAIYVWWQEQGSVERDAYTEAVYPVGFSPTALRRTDSGTSTGLNPEQRTLWFTMLALACFQSLGRTQDAQHRQFIERGMNRGWWHELARSKPPTDVRSWLDLLERWSAPDAWGQTRDPPALPWRRTFVDLYAVCRHLDVYVDILRRLPRIIREHGPVSLNEILNPAHSPKVQPLGLEAARLDRSLGIGANWMIRELVRHGVYDARDAAGMAPYCWATTRRVRRLLRHLDREAIRDSADKDASRFVFEFITEQLGSDRAPFGGDFDLPLQLVTRKEYGNTLARCFGEAGSEAPSLADEDDGIAGHPAGEESDE